MVGGTQAYSIGERCQMTSTCEKGREEMEMLVIHLVGGSLEGTTGAHWFLGEWVRSVIWFSLRSGRVGGVVGIGVVGPIAGYSTGRPKITLFETTRELRHVCPFEPSLIG